MSIAFKEGLTIPPPAVNEIILAANQDIRQVSIKLIWATTWQNQQNECAPSEDSDQPGHRLWLDWADAQADLSLRWVHTHFVGFVMSWLI